MQIALLLLLAAAGPDDDARANRFYELIDFRKPEKPDPDPAEIVELLSKKEHWTGAFKRIEEKLGKFPDEISLTVQFTLDSDELGRASGQGLKGEINFNLKALTAYQRKIDDAERRRKESVKENKVFMYRVPPVKFERIIYHELTHIFQHGGDDAPKWFNEGMAQLIGDDPNAMYGFLYAERRCQAVDIPLLERNDIYARGHLFWLWLQSRGAVKKTVELAVLERRPWKEALETATGMGWPAILALEREWSAKELEKIK